MLFYGVTDTVINCNSGEKSIYFSHHSMRRTALCISMVAFLGVYCLTPEILQIQIPHQNCCCQGRQCSCCEKGGSAINGFRDMAGSCRCSLRAAKHDHRVVAPELSKLDVYSTTYQLFNPACGECSFSTAGHHLPVFAAPIFHPPNV